MRHSKLFNLNKPMTDKPDFMKTIDQMANISRPRKWCLNHPVSNWSSGFPQCTQGFQKGEPCEEGKDE